MLHCPTTLYTDNLVICFDIHRFTSYLSTYVRVCVCDDCGSTIIQSMFTLFFLTSTWLQISPNQYLLMTFCLNISLISHLPYLSYPLSLSLSFSRSLSLFSPLSLYLFLSIPLSFSHSLFLSLSLSISPFISLSIFFSLSLSLSLSLSIPLSLSAYFSG